jgi:hypothetical protein
VKVTGCIVSPLSSSRGAFPALSVTQGQRVDNAYRFMARDAPLGWWSRVVWHHPDGRNRSMTVLGGPLKYASSPETTHVSATLHARARGGLMAKIDWILKPTGREADGDEVSHLGGVQNALRPYAHEKRSPRATWAHSPTGLRDARITVTRGDKLDWFVNLNDERGQLAAAAIEFGNKYGGGGIAPLRNAIGLRFRTCADLVVVNFCDGNTIESVGDCRGVNPHRLDLRSHFEYGLTCGALHVVREGSVNVAVRPARAVEVQTDFGALPLDERLGICSWKRRKRMVFVSIPSHGA